MTFLPIAVTTTGGAGVSAGNASKPLVGDNLFMAIHIPTQASIVSGASDVTIKTIMGDGSFVTLLTLTDVVTPYYNAVQITSVNATGAAGGLVNPLVSGLNVAIAQGNDGTSNIWVDVVFVGN